MNHISIRNLKKRAVRMRPSLLIILTFAFIILTGSLILNLPFASANRESIGFLKALFTATSATCVTGLSLIDLYESFSFFGQLIIFLLIEVGGLGFMSIVSIFFFLLKKNPDFSKLMLMAQSLGADDMEEILSLQKRLLTGSFFIQLTGAIILTLRFHFHYGFSKAIWLGIFHAGSAFCNAGFDLLGFVSPSSSLIPFQTDGVLLLTISLLIITGGIGFVVWDEVIRKRSFRRLSVYSKLALITTLFLLTTGTILFYLLEKDHGTLLGQAQADKILTAFFQSVTTRTAGFTSINQGDLSASGKVLTMILMFIGGCSGSTAGGLKAVTFALIMIFLLDRFTGKKKTHIFYREIPESLILDAMTIFCLMILLSLAGSMVLLSTSSYGFSACLYEAISALATVGLSTGITGDLSTLSDLTLILLMFIGRVGILTISMGFFQPKKDDFSYPKTNLLIG